LVPEKPAVRPNQGPQKARGVLSEVEKRRQARMTAGKENQLESDNTSREASSVQNFEARGNIQTALTAEIASVSLDAANVL
jgi:hypothetical protein